MLQELHFLTKHRTVMDSLLLQKQEKEDPPQRVHTCLKHLELEDRELKERRR